MRSRIPRTYLLDVLIALLLLGLPLIFFFPVTLGSKTLIPADNLYQYEPWASARASQGVPDVAHNALLSDLVLQNYQWKHFLRQSLQAREIPLWQPAQFSGTPFLANGQHSALYPFSLLYYVLPLERAFGWFTVSQLWLAGLLMFVFLRGIGLGRFAGVVGAVSYQLSNFFVAATVHPMIQAAAVWLPLCLLMLEFILQGRSLGPGTQNRAFDALPWVLLGGLALGMSFLAGHIEITYYTLLVMALYVGLRLLLRWRESLRQWRDSLRVGLLALLMVLLGFGIGAAQFLPLLEVVDESFRTERSTLAEVRSYALPARHLPLWLMPNFYGNPAEHAYFHIYEGASVAQALQTNDPATPKTDTFFGIKNYVEGAVYVGVLPLLLAIIGAVGRLGPGAAQRLRGPYRLLFGLLGGLALLFAFGTPFYALLYYLLPGVKQLHTPFRWAWLISFVLCSFAAFGAELLWQRSDRRIVRAVAGGAIAGGLLLGGLLLFSWQAYDAVAGVAEQLYSSLNAAQAFASPQDFFAYLWLNLAIFTGLLLAAGLALWLCDRAWAWRGLPLGAGTIVLLIAFDLFLLSADFNPAAEKAWLHYRPPAIAWLQAQQQDTDPFRIQAYEWKEGVLQANAGWQYGLQDVRGYDSLFSRQYAEFMGRITPQGGLAFNRIDPVYYHSPELLLHPYYDLLNVRYFVTDFMIQGETGDYPLGMSLEEAGLELAYEDTGVRIYENLDAFPRAYGVAGEEAPSLEQLTREALEPATITDYRNSEVSVDIVREAAGWLVLGDSYAPGWRAFVRPQGGSLADEREVPVARVLGNFRGVQLPAGAWTLRFDYSPQRFQLGAFASFVTGMLVIFLALVWLWRRFISEAAEADSARRVVKNSLAPIFLNLFNRGIDFAFAFIMLRILAPEGAGIYYYAIVIFGWFDILTNFGLNTLLTREVSRDRSQAWAYLLNTTALRLGLGVLGVPLLLGFLLLRNLTVDPPLTQSALAAIALLYLGLLPNSISTGLSALFYAFEKAEYPAALATISTLVKVTLGLGALLLGWGVVGLAGVSVITNLVTVVLMLRLALPLLQGLGGAGRSLLSRSMMRGMMSESWALMLNHFLATIFFKSDVILIEAIKGAAIVGMYSTAYKWLDALNIIPAFFTMALLPLMARQAHEDRTALRRNYLFGVKTLVAIAIPAAVAITALAYLLIGVLGGEEYLPDGAIALQLMIWSIPLGWINSLTQYVLIALDRQRQITFAFVAAVGFNLAGNLLFIPVYSYRAAAVTTILSEGVLLLGFWLLLRKDLGSISFGRALWRSGLAGVAMVALLWLLWDINSVVALLLALLLYSLLLVLLKPLSPEEGQRLERVLPAQVRRWVVQR